MEKTNHLLHLDAKVLTKIGPEKLLNAKVGNVTFL